jgi:hypothetical protein
LIHDRRNHSFGNCASVSTSTASPTSSQTLSLASAPLPFHLSPLQQRPRLLGNRHSLLRRLSLRIRPERRLMLLIILLRRVESLLVPSAFHQNQQLAAIWSSNPASGHTYGSRLSGSGAHTKGSSSSTIIRLIARGRYHLLGIGRFAPGLSCRTFCCWM